MSKAHLPNAVARFARAFVFTLGLHILMAGTTTVNAASGSLDPAFGNAGVRYPAGTGRLIPSFPNQHLAIASDGSIYVAGQCNTALSNIVCIRKFGANGALDTDFGVAGYRALTTADYTFYSVLGIALTAGSEHVTVAGSCAVTAATATSGTCIVRFDTSGNALTHFQGGTSEFYFSGNSATVFAQLPSGVLAVAGYCSSGSTTFCTQMVSATGQPLGSLLDLDSPGDSVSVRAIAVKSDGGLWLINNCQSASLFEVCVVKFSAYNVIDTSFGVAGTLLLAETSILAPALIQVTAATVQPDGKLLIAGICASNGPYRCIKRYRIDGSIDATWASSSATPYTLLLGRHDSGVEESLVVLGDGKIVYGTTARRLILQPTTDPPRYELAVHRIDADGVPDATFGADGNGKVRVSAWDGSGAEIDSGHSAITATRDDALIVLGHCKPALGVNSLTEPCLAKLSGGPLDYARCSADIDGDGVVTVNDSLLLARVSLGLTGNAVTQGLAFKSHATRKSWVELRSHLVNHCGMSVAP